MQQKTTSYFIYKLIVPLLLIAIIALSSCKKREILPDEIKTYIHLSHTRTNKNPYIDSIVEKMDFKKFDMVWLGGDLATLTSADINTMKHIDNIFNLGAENTLWSLGNHDYTNLDLVHNFTHRPNFYAFYKDRISFLVLDTQDSLSNIVGEQKALFQQIVDTIQNSDYFILLHHKLIWMYGNPNLEPLINSVSNAGLGSCFYCINPNNFYSDIYPGLIKIKERGIEVICIGGDIGFNTKSFEYKTKDGIYFLASGINADSPDNKILIFKNNLTTHKLTWQFKLLSDYQ